MITIPKLPSLEPEMKGALRRYIMRKRHRMKQEMEQDAIEKRLKKERERKRIQDAMTLDQIKEQLSGLEKKLETLRGEKHDLFVQLKQVLNEGNLKRKQVATTATTAIETSSAPNEQKRLKTEDGYESEKSDASANRMPYSGNNAAGRSGNNQHSERTSRFAHPDQPLQDLNQQQKLQSIKQEVSLSSPNIGFGSIKTTQLAQSDPSAYMSPMHNTIKHIQSKQPEMTGLSRHDPLLSASIDSQNLAPMHQLGNSFTRTSAPTIPPELLMMSNRLQSNYQNITSNESHKFPMNQMHLNVPMSLSHKSGLLTGGFADQSTGPGPAGMSDSQPPFTAHPEQFFIDNGLPPNFVHLNLLTHGLALGNLGLQQMSLGASVPPGSPNIPLTPANYNMLKPLPHQISKTGLDYSSSSQTKPGADGAGLPTPGSYRQAYPSQSSSHSSSPSSTSMYHGQDYNPSFQTSMTGLQQTGRPTRHHNLTSSRRNHYHHQHQPQQPSQHDQTSRSNFPNSTYYKRPSPKNPYYPNRLYDND